MRAVWISALAISAVLSLGCGGAPAQALVKAPEFNPDKQTKCNVTKSQLRPLIVEWPAADRGALEAQKQRGLVAVRYNGCEMEVLRQCKVAGSYAYTPVTPKQDRISMTTADELYANIPVYAAKFEGKLASAGHLDVDMTVVGSFDADRGNITRAELDGSCRGATHYVSSLTAGAFEFTAGGSAEVGAEAELLGAGSGGKSEATREILNRDGYKKACGEATTSDAQPPEGCGALLRVEVVELGAAAVEVAAPAPTGAPAPMSGEVTGAVAPEPASGPGVMNLHIDSDETVQLIRLGAMQAVPFGGAYVNMMALRQRELVCTSPCDSWVDARQGAEFVIAGEGVMETDAFQLGAHEGDVKMRVDAGSASAMAAGYVLVWTGAPLMVFWAIIPIGFAIDDGGSAGSSSKDVFVAMGAIGGGIGTALLAIGIPLLVTSDTDYEVAVDGRGIGLRF